MAYIKRAKYVIKDNDAIKDELLELLVEEKGLKIGLVALLLFLSVTCTTQFLVFETQNQIVQPTVIVNAKSSSQDIKLIQKKLKNWGYYKGKVDGIYGSGTKNAVILFQKRNKLPINALPRRNNNNG